MRQDPSKSDVGAAYVRSASEQAEIWAANSKNYYHGMTRAVEDIKKILHDFVDTLTLNSNVFDPAAVQAAEGK